MKIELKQFYGNVTKFPEVAKKNPIIRAVFAVHKVSEDLKADFYAASTALGVIEGFARVTLDECDLDQKHPIM